MLTELPISGRLALLPLLCLLGIPPGFADSAGFNSDDTITITADRGWEGEDADVIHFSGNFELHAPDWSMAGDTAAVYGKLDNPDKVLVEGSPATVSFLRNGNEHPDDADAQERVDGAADFVEYYRATDKLTMRGAAHLIRKQSTLTSQIIEYDVETDHYSASGEGGIDIQYNPEDD